MLSVIKSWGWYGWVKRVLAVALVMLCIVNMVGVCWYGVVTDGWALAGLMLLFYAPFILLPLLGMAWLVWRDFRSPYVVLIIFAVLFMLLGALAGGAHVWRFANIMVMCVLAGVIFVSGVCIRRLGAVQRATGGAELGGVALVSLIVVWTMTVVMVLNLLGGFFLWGYDEFNIEQKCIETKIAQGYPEDFAREYCFGPGQGCVSKAYVENCEVGLKCCFATVAEDMRWNYLEYDAQGNKIAE